MAVLIGYVTNRDGYSQLKLCNVNSGETLWSHDSIDMIDGFDFSSYGLAFTLATSTQNKNVCLLDLRTHDLV